MQMRTKLLIVTVFGAGALLIAALAVIIAPPPQIAYAQNSQPTVQIELNHTFGNATPGQPLAQYTFLNFQSITCNANDGNQHSVDRSRTPVTIAPRYMIVTPIAAPR